MPTAQISIFDIFKRQLENRNNKVRDYKIDSAIKKQGAKYACNELITINVISSHP